MGTGSVLSPRSRLRIPIARPRRGRSAGCCGCSLPLLSVARRSSRSRASPHVLCVVCPRSASCLSSLCPPSVPRLCSKPRGIQAARQLRLHRKSQRWADKKFNKARKHSRSTSSTSTERDGQGDARHKGERSHTAATAHAWRRSRLILFRRFAPSLVVCRPTPAPCGSATPSEALRMPRVSSSRKCKKNTDTTHADRSQSPAGPPHFAGRFSTAVPSHRSPLPFVAMAAPYAR